MSLGVSTSASLHWSMPYSAIISAWIRVTTCVCVCSHTIKWLLFTEGNKKWNWLRSMCGTNKKAKARDRAAVGRKIKGEKKKTITTKKKQKPTTWNSPWCPCTGGSILSLWMCLKCAYCRALRKLKDQILFININPCQAEIMPFTIMRALWSTFVKSKQYPPVCLM